MFFTIFDSPLKLLLVLFKFLRLGTFRYDFMIALELTNELLRHENSKKNEFTYAVCAECKPIKMRTQPIKNYKNNKMDLVFSLEKDCDFIFL